MMHNNLADSFNSYFRLIYADTDELLKQVFKIRYDVFCEELRLEENCPKDIEKDEFDIFAKHFLLQHKQSGEFAGTVRFVIPPQGSQKPGFPIEKYCLDTIDKSIVDLASLPPGTYGEVSRLAVPSRFRRRAGEKGKPYIVDSPQKNPESDKNRLFPYISVGLYLVCAALFVEKKLDYAFIMAEPRLARAMARIGIKFERCGEIMEYHGQRAPFYIDQEMLQKGMKPEVASLFKLIRSTVKTQLSKSGQRHKHKKAS